MKHLIIVGARGWGREVYSAAQNTQAYRMGEYDIKGFLDSKSDALDGMNGNYPPILGSPENYQIENDDVFFIAMGDPQWRKHYAELMANKGAKFQTIISGTAGINSTAIIGEGAFIGGYSQISDNVVVGNHAMIHGFCTIGHNAVIEEYASLGAYVFLGGYAHVGKNSNLAPKSMIIRMKGVGDNVMVGAGSIVIRTYGDNLHLFGNPAKKIDF